MDYNKLPEISKRRLAAMFDIYVGHLLSVAGAKDPRAAALASSWTDRTSFVRREKDIE